MLSMLSSEGDFCFYLCFVWTLGGNQEVIKVDDLWSFWRGGWNCKLDIMLILITLLVKDDKSVD